MAGLSNKDGDFWKGLEKWDVVGMSQTWMEEGRWRKVEGSLPRGYVWERQWARREKKRGRAMGGMLMGVRKGLEVGVEEEGGREGIMTKKIRMGGVVEGSGGLCKRRFAEEVGGHRGVDGREGGGSEGVEGLVLYVYFVCSIIVIIYIINIVTAQNNFRCRNCITTVRKRKRKKNKRAPGIEPKTSSTVAEHLIIAATTVNW